ncbi:MAG: tripartite tricarboxylate transporter substrate binding protein [Betaproteobacteria bacterium]|nr:tripartite tricarboxylate transporter substrate binding protein [Betaproteobacteria bacterium]
MRFPTALPCALALALLGLSISTGASAQGAWPSKPIRFIVPFPPGGGADATARIIAQELSKSFGQQVIVENRGGGGGTVGVGAGMKSPPDGHTVFLGTPGPIAVSPTLLPDLAYDPRRDMAPVSKLSTAALLVAVPGSSAIRSLGDLIAAARAKPGSLSFATGGTGTSHHLAGELLKQMTGIDMTHIPYKGTAPATTDTMAGQVPLGIIDLHSALPHVRSGKLRSIGTTGAKRSAFAPDIATIAENGLPGFDVTTWFIMGAPAGVPREVIARLNAETARALALPEVRERILGTGNEPASSTPEELAAFVREEIARWAKVIKAAGVKAG